MLVFAGTAREMPRWAKMSAILPIDTTVPPAAVTRSSRVSACGGVVRSLRLVVRWNVSALSPTNGRAITRPILSGAVSSLATAQTA